MRYLNSYCVMSKITGVSICYYIPWIYIPLHSFIVNTSSALLIQWRWYISMDACVQTLSKLLSMRVRLLYYLCERKCISRHTLEVLLTLWRRNVKYCVKFWNNFLNTANWSNYSTFKLHPFYRTVLITLIKTSQDIQVSNWQYWVWLGSSHNFNKMRWTIVNLNCVSTIYSSVYFCY